ncbi:TlpA family protein disulfide reductase [Gluconobacter sphaericus]|uniref:TlpA family protein disulfide reductase n=1 Tax=Gluconobacter sphaericus TaxID=574987 RepID=UPI001B8CD5C5|nr:TlpA family protein disulfide reductase [Gluconobacter sphaericus]MBS1098967.1 TlpA family protein disulfide reductase [Gluconobacter sphaericus]
MRARLSGRRSILLGTVGLAAAAGYGAARLAETVVRPGMPISDLTPGKAVSGPIGFGLAGLGSARFVPASRRGAPFLLHVWATWCSPCLHELPGLAAFMKAWGPDCPVVPVAVSSGSPEEIHAFLERNDVTGLPVWAVVEDDLKAWCGDRARAIPVTFLIDDAGCIRATAEGALDWAAPGAPAALRRLFAAMRA